jgi:transposase-like protein
MAKSKNRSKRYSQAERAQLVELYRQSGCSLWRFSQEMNLGYETLKRWLKDEAFRFNLVEVTATEESLDRRVQLAVRLPNGLVCELGGDLSPEEVLNWVRELRAC